MDDRPRLAVVADDAAAGDRLVALARAAGCRALAIDPVSARSLELRGIRCLLIDLRSGRHDPLELLGAIQLPAASVPTVLVVGRGDVATAVRAFRLGAVDVLEEGCRDEDLQAALTSAIDVGTRPPTEALAAAKVANLTRRERQVLAGILAGKSTAGIAVDLGISRRTADVYRTQLYAKLGVSSISGAVMVAYASGFALPSAGGPDA